MSTLLGWLFVWVISAVIIAGIAYILPGVRIKNFGTALWVAIILGFVNMIIRPFFVILTIPFTIITLGLFIFVINALMVLLTSRIVRNFQVDGFWNAFLFSVLVSLLRGLLLFTFSY